ncbi:hypothetical protein B0F90DRAFT_1762173 [Multifurca ochricompacta]|uniref:Myb-like domain-containing protein n=1 Tax=Multifurca ochricompacta TaxID=376703 RepID=A0AAD4LXI5_9AGAM|nr:hypothetical protein B0F90DRAFT_1762173 [Multifurca ochricompacta]
MQLPLQNTFEALEAYVQSQKTLLARTQSDIDRLRVLREQAALSPEEFFDSLDEKLNDNTLCLEHQPEIAAEVQDKINWDLFKGIDPTPFQTFAADLRAMHYARSQPSTTQQSALSSVQQLVRSARRTIVEPVLASFELSSDSSDDEQQPAPDNLRRAQQREQLRRIHLRKSGLTLRASGVHVRRDIEDESADVDIATDGEPLALTPNDLITSLPLPSPAEPHAMSNSRMRSPRPSRSRRPLPTRSPATETKAKMPVLKAAKQSYEPDRPPPGAAAVKKEKPKSETYKQAWSISEQHLLERLLTEIPDGEKNRWSKISKAMGGRRTPRQVASRVQKYFEKLRFFGVNVEQASIS